MAKLQRPADPALAVILMLSLARAFVLALAIASHLAFTATARAQVVITEFVASNTLGLKDDDGDSEDWIELHNPGSTPVRLLGWSLTDTESVPSKWEFPDIAIGPGEFLIVFASDKDRRSPGRTLHTNFRLSDSGEYLALVRPDLTAASRFAPAYPPQVAGVSYGFPVSATRVSLLAPGAPGRFLVPTGPDAVADNAWTRPGFADATWTTVTNPIGWDAGTDPGDVVIADSAADWTFDGGQGGRGWCSGSYARYADANGSYSAAEFLEFSTGEWNGSAWASPAAGTPRITLSATHGRPAGSNNGGERWVIRRWHATVSGTLTIQWRVAKRAAGGTGVNARLLHKGLQRDAVTLAASDTVGSIRTSTLTDIAYGDPIDLALTPFGQGGVTDDIADEAAFGMVISAPSPIRTLIRTDVADLMRGRNASGLVRVPFVTTELADLDQLELQLRYDDGFVAWLNGTPVASRNAPVEAVGGVVGDQADDWSGTGDQGVKGWYYGFYDQASDADRVYDPRTDFDGSHPEWTWDGTGRVLGLGDPPWTRIDRDRWHPSGRAGSVNVQWAIRRWASQTAGTVKVLLSGAMQEAGSGCAGGNGVTFRVLVDGSPRFARTVAAGDTAGFTTTVVLEDLDFGDDVDFILDPTGADGSTDGGCDGATFHAAILQDPAPGLAWDSVATRSRTAAEAARIETFDLTRHRDLLVAGTNILAFQVLNAARGDSDLLLLPELTGRYARLAADQPRYFTAPSPGTYNLGGVETLGPVIDRVDHTPNVPADAEDLVVTAHVRPTLRPVASVRLAYRVMFAAEQSLGMFDDGRHGDGAAGDGLWAARIPAAAAGPGQMIRWAVTATDTTGNALRFPPYPDPRKSPQYDGTIVADPSVASSPIPVLHWFLSSPTAADSDTGTRGAVFFDGEFHDNVGANAHGQSTRGFPKRSYDLDFNPGHKFRWRAGQPRVDDLNLLTSWADKAHFRNTLAYETYEQAGAPAHFAFPVRIQQNAKFHSLASLVENGDDNFLHRLGLDPNGALYKMYNAAENATGGEKKTRKTEGTTDLTALINGVRNGTTAARLAFLHDNVDLPGMVNFLAARAITADNDCCHKNYYLYRDTLGSGEWTAFPWDVDLTFGRVWTCGSPCYAYFDERIYTNTGLFVGNNNSVFSAVLNTPSTRQMYLRRVRTLMDEITQPPGVAPSEDRWLRRTTELRDLLTPAAQLDLAKWGTWGRRETLAQAVDRIHREFLPARRNYLYRSSVPSTLPQAQPATADLRISQVGFRSPGGSPLQDHLVLTNANAFAVDVSDWRLEGPVRFRFKPGTVLPARSGAIVAAHRPSFRARIASPRGGEGRLILGDYQGDLSSRGGTLSLLDRSGRTVHTTAFPGDPSPAQQYLRITELHVAPPASDAELEFIELRNTGPIPLDLAGIRFTQGITFDFSTGTVPTLPPGARVLVVRNLAAFRARHGAAPALAIAGQYFGSLDNAGERVRLIDDAGEVILDFTYQRDWVPAAMGLGFSLIATRDDADWTAWNEAAHWRSSRNPGGSPGADEPPPSAEPPPVVIHELLTHTDPPQLDAIELHNPSSQPAPIGGWWLTDDPAEPRKFRIPANTVIPPGGFQVFDESDFNNPPDGPASFRLSSQGDDVWLFAADAAGNPTGHATGASVDAAANGVPFGRHTNSLGAVRFVPQISATLGAANSGPRIGPVILNEIHFAPGRGDIPFVELRNLASTPVPLFDPAAPTHTWRLDGVDFEFPTGFTLPPGGLVLVVGGDPVRFRSTHAIPADIPVLGPWNGTLQTDGERLALVRPDAPDPLPDGTFLIPYLTIDEVRFRDTAPWPVTTGNPGDSLQRRTPVAWADDPAAWRPSGGPPSPGVSGTVNRPPVVSAGAAIQLESILYPVAIPLAGIASDDGLPGDPEILTATWSTVAGPAPTEFDDPTRPGTVARIPGPGRYVLRLTAFDGELSRSADVTVQVTRPGVDLIPILASSAWRYFAEGRAPAAGWTLATFDDSAWRTGEAQFGYGDGDERTVLAATVNGARLLTAYFRRTFVLTNPGEIRTLIMDLLRDDGAEVWLNGVSAHRVNLPDGPATYATLATGTVSGTDESAFFEQTLNPSLLRSGTNLIAVEVHQQSEASSDLSFDLALRIQAQPSNQAPAIAAAGTIPATAGQPFRLAVSWSDDGLPAPATLAWRQIDGPGTATFSATDVAAPFVTLSMPGTHTLRFTVFDGTLTATRDVRIEATADPDPDADYRAWQARHFNAAELGDPSLSGDDADPDRDRQSNLAEYRTGTDPRSAASVLRLQAALGTAGAIRIEVPVIAGHRYRVEWSPRMPGNSAGAGAGAADWQLLQELPAAAADGTATLLDPQPALDRPARYYRVVAP